MSFIKHQQLGEEGQRFMSATKYVEDNLEGKVFYNRDNGQEKMISTVPLGLSGTKLQGSDPDFFLTTKGYVDEQIEEVKTETKDLKKGLSAAVLRIDSLEAFENNFYVDDHSETPNKPDSNDIATLTIIHYPKYLSAGIEDCRVPVVLDLSDFARLNNPNFTGAPSAPTPGKTDDSTRIATTAFVNDVILHKVIDPNATDYGNLSINTMKQVNQALDNDKNFAKTIKNSIDARLLESKIDVTVYNNDIPDDKKTQNTDGTRDIAVIKLKDTDHTLKAYTGDLAPKLNPTLEGTPYAPSNDGKLTPSPIATYKDIQDSVKSVMGIDAYESQVLGNDQHHFANVQLMAEQVANNIDAISSLESNSQKSSPVLDAIAKISLGSSDDTHVKIIYTNYNQNWLGQNIHNEALSFISAGNKENMAAYLNVPRIEKSTVGGEKQFDVVTGGAAEANDIDPIHWDQLIAGHAVQAIYASAAYGDTKSIKETYATKDEIAALTGGDTAVDKAVRDSSGHVFEDHYLPIANGVTAVSLVSSTTSEKKTQIGTLKVTLGSDSQSSSVSSAFYVDLSNYAKLSLGADVNASQVFDRRPYIKVNDTLTSQAITVDEVAHMLGVPSGNPSGATLNLSEVTTAITNINGSINTISSAVTVLQGGKQNTTQILDKLAWAGGQSVITNTKNQILYTYLPANQPKQSKNMVFGFTTLTEEARTMLSKDQAGIKEYLGIGIASGGSGVSKDDMAAADYALYDDVEAGKLDNKIKIADKYVTRDMVYDISGRASSVQPNHLNWSGDEDNTVKPVSFNTLAFWDGRYDDVHSNLRYFRNSGGSTISFDDMVINMAVSGSDFWIQQAGKNVNTDGWSKVGNINHTYKFVVGSKASLTSDVSVAASVGTVYLNLYDSLKGASPSVTVDSSVAFKAGDNVTISADKNRNITFAAADTRVTGNHTNSQTGKYYILSHLPTSATAAVFDSTKPVFTSTVDYNTKTYFTIDKDGYPVFPYIKTNNLIAEQVITEKVVTTQVIIDSSLSTAGGVSSIKIDDIPTSITSGSSSTATDISEGAGGIPFAVCETYLENSAKRVTLNGVTKLTDGMHLTVLFIPLEHQVGYTPPDNYQTASLTLQVNNLDACPIHYNGVQVQQSFLTSQCCYSFVYYTGIWYIIGSAFTLISTNVENNTSN